MRYFVLIAIMLILLSCSEPPTWDNIYDPAVTLAPVTDLTVVIASETALQLNWVFSDTAVNFRIDKKVGNSNWQSGIALLPITQFTYTDNDVTLGNNYSYRVTVVADQNQSSATEKSIAFFNNVASPTFSLPSGTYTSSQSVTISCITSGATIRYTTNGSTPTSTSPLYSSPIIVTTTTTLKAQAFKSGWTDSPVTTATYTITINVVATPTFNPPGGSYTSTQDITISCTTSGTTIRYTTNGSTPTSTSPVYSSPINLTTTTTLKAKAFKSGWTDSPVATATYTITINVVATPTFNPPGGSYTTSQNVTITSTTSGATIRYTTNGSTPTSSSTLYTYPIPMTTTTTLKAKAFKTGWTDSQIATATYTITINVVATPTFNPPGGSYTTSQNVTITSTTSGATIRYTTNGSTPTSTSPIYSSPINVAITTTLKARAFKTNWTNSEIASATYILNSEDAWLQWDNGVNDDSIGLTNGGTMYCAVRFDQADLIAFVGSDFTQLELFINDVPSNMVIHIWQGANAGTEVMSQAYTPSGTSWNTIDLTNPVTIESAMEYWIGYEVTHAVGQYCCGCDTGPAIVGKGDWVAITPEDWDSLAGLGLDYNWNIHVYVEVDGRRLPLFTGNRRVNNITGSNTRHSSNSSGAYTGISNANPFSVASTSKTLEN
ncbi:MAG: chitobiase/beta-hexosaminidase C-terminal domain-containing protein [Candidatus Cloacimonetes bacterium]|nr:chitobiase/beta-hexosaminidase C-terminal domain-containing protein [Candidatus Cloacimonadota bacterium]